MWVIYSPGPEILQARREPYEYWAKRNNQDLTKPFEILPPKTHTQPKYEIKVPGSSFGTSFVARDVFKPCQEASFKLEEYL